MWSSYDDTAESLYLCLTLWAFEIMVLLFKTHLYFVISFNFTEQPYVDILFRMYYVMGITKQASKQTIKKGHVI